MRRVLAFISVLLTLLALLPGGVGAHAPGPHPHAVADAGHSHAAAQDRAAQAEAAAAEAGTPDAPHAGHPPDCSMVVGHCTGVLPPPEIELTLAPERLRLARRPLSQTRVAGSGPEAETPPPRA